jgi:hypothetical protein
MPKLKVTYPDGRIEEIVATGGEAHWRNPVTHALENVGNTEAHALVVEPKNTCKQ